MIFYTNKGKNLLEIFSIAFFSWCIGFLIFFAGGLLLLNRMGYLETFDDYNNKVSAYVDERIEKKDLPDFRAPGYKQARAEYDKYLREIPGKKMALSNEYKRENPRKTIEVWHQILLIGILPLAFTLLVSKKYNGSLINSIEISGDIVTVAKKNKKIKKYDMNNYFVQLFTTTVISWKHLFIPYKLYHVNLLDIADKKKLKDTIYLYNFNRKDLEEILELIEGYQKRYV